MKAAHQLPANLIPLEEKFLQRTQNVVQDENIFLN
jgi:hypothetical protein